MGDTNTTESPLEAAAGAAGPRATKAFSILANETRLSILLALWEAFEPWEGENALSFTELRKRVGMRDGSQFNYHLDQLVGHFVRQTDDGYELRRAGHQLVRTVIAGTAIEEPSIDPTEIDTDCVWCNAPTELSYADGELHLVCTECVGHFGSRYVGQLGGGEDRRSGLLVMAGLDSAGVADRTPEQVYNAKLIQLRKWTLSLIEGVCHVCSGPTDISLDICENHDSDGVCENCKRRERAFVQLHCTICKNAAQCPPFFLASNHPRVIAFYSERGVPLQYDVSGPERNAGGFAGKIDQEVLSEEPPRVRVSYQYEGDRLELRVDGDMNVVEVTEPD